MIIGLTGPAFAGKDTAGRYLARAHHYALFAFADPIRDGLRAMLGLTDRDFFPENKEKPIPWAGKSPRQFMQLLGTEWGRELIDQDIWIKHMAQRLARAEQAGDSIVITDVRFYGEADMIRAKGGEIWRIERPGAATTASNTHISEIEAAAIATDRTLLNDGTREQLYTQLDAALEAALHGAPA